MKFRTPLFATIIFSVISVAPSLGQATDSKITEKDIRSHAEYLASDALEGRGTGTKALDQAARYIEKEFKRYGVAPANGNSYLQTFDATTGIALGKNNSLTITAGGKNTPLALETDFIPLSFTANESVTGEVVFLGFGIRASQFDHNDYGDLDVRDKIVLVMSGYPDGDDPHSNLATVASVRNKALYAREAGARALLVVRPDTSMTELAKLQYDNSPSTAGIVCVNITRRIADILLASAQTDLATVWNDLKQTKKSASMQLPGVSITLSAAVEFTKKPTSNVVGLVRGSDPALNNRYIVVGAHYDHLGWGQDGSLYRGSTPMIHNGADDNASGTAGLLELAQYFNAPENKPKRSLLFLAFTAEEMGLLGSTYFTAHSTVPVTDIEAMINLDMIGRMPDSTRELNVQGIGTSPVWKELVQLVNEPFQFKLKLIDDGQGPSDHAAFYMKDIPVLFFFNGLHSDYHKPSDDIEKLNTKNESSIVQFVADVVTKLDARSEKLAFTKVKPKEGARRASAFNVYVGTIPDYGSEEKGFKISGVSDGSPAEKAGLKGGDVIVKFGKTSVQSIYDYMGALGEHKPGEDVPVVVKRGNEEITLTVHLEKKK